MLFALRLNLLYLKSLVLYRLVPLCICKSICWCHSDLFNFDFILFHLILSRHYRFCRVCRSREHLVGILKLKRKIQYLQQFWQCSCLRRWKASFFSSFVSWIENRKASRFQMRKSLRQHQKWMLPWFAHYDATQHWSKIYYPMGSEVPKWTDWETFWILPTNERRAILNIRWRH